MIVRRCDVLDCDKWTSEKNPGRDWLRIDAVVHLIGDTPERAPLDACGREHATELLDEIGEQL